MGENKNIWLGALLLAQVVVIALVYRPGGGEKTAAKLLPGFSTTAVSGIEITDNDKNQVGLVKKNGVWQVKLKDKSLYPADKNKVEKLLVKIAALSTDRLVSSSVAAQRRLEVAADHFNRRIVLAEGADSTGILLGTSPGYRKVHVRRADSDAIFLVRDLAAWEVAAKANSWWQRNYLDYAPAKVLAVSLKNSHGVLAFKRGAAGSPWQAEDSRKLDQDKVKSLVGDLCRLTITDLLVDKNFRPAGAPIATLSISGGGGEARLTVWDKEKKDGDYIVDLNGNSHYARAASYALDRLLAAKMSAVYRQKKDRAKKPEQS